MFQFKVKNRISNILLLNQEFQDLRMLTMIWVFFYILLLSSQKRSVFQNLRMLLEFFCCVKSKSESDSTQLLWVEPTGLQAPTNGTSCSVCCRICSGRSSSTARASRLCSNSAMSCSTMATRAVATRRATPSSRPATVWTGGGGTSATCPWRGG